MKENSLESKTISGFTRRNFLRCSIAGTGLVLAHAYAFGVEHENQERTDLYIKQNLGKRENLAQMLWEFPERTTEILADGWLKKYGNYISKAVNRAVKDAPHVKNIFSSYSLPEESAITLGIIESWWREKSVSDMGATGIFQQMEKTAIEHGAVIAEDYDDRINPVISSEIAAKKLKSDFEFYGNWDLAFNAYNSGSFPQFYKKQEEIEISNERYVRFLGKIFGKTQNLEKIGWIREQLYFIVKRKAVEREKEKYPEAYSVQKDDSLKIHEISSKPSEHVVKSGETLSRIARDYLERRYNGVTKEGINRMVGIISDAENINKNMIRTGSRIQIPTIRTLAEIEYLTGKKLEELNPHIKGRHSEIPDRGKIVV